MESDPLLPTSEENSNLTAVRPSPKHILKIALRIKQLIDIIVPIDFDPTVVERADSPVITQRVLELVRQAAGGQGEGARGSSSRGYQATLVFVLLTVKRWFETSATEELVDANLYNLRANCAEQIAARLIEAERDEKYLFRDVLCQRYSITLHGEDSAPANALEVAVDLHATKIIATAGYQRCRTWLWRGWIVQSAADPDIYVFYKKAASTDFKTHFNPDRIKTPQYQNLILLGFSVIYLVLYTFTINTLQRSGEFDWSEALFYLFTLGSIVDEVVKLYHVGLNYIGFWSAFNDTLYFLVVVSFVFRALALNHNPETPTRIDYLVQAYRLLACCAPFIWCRLLLYLDALQFFGAMLVVLSQLIQESVIFFVLLLAVSAGFFQAFIGLDSSDGSVDFLNSTAELMFMTIMGNPAYDALDNLAHPYGQILYYFFAFLICTLLLNILVALFASAYGHIYDNATEEYLALLAEKTLRFVRAPDENVYVPPLNLFELVFATLPFEWWMSDSAFAKLNQVYLTVIYSPVLVFTAYGEARAGRRIKYNRQRGLPDDANERDQEWDLLDGYDSDDEVDDSSSDDNEAQFRAVIASHHKRLDATHNGVNLRHETSAELEQMNQAIARGDPEFHTDERSWLKDVIRSAPQIELGDKSGAGWNNYWLVKEIRQLNREIVELKKSVAAAKKTPAPAAKQAAPAPAVTAAEISKIVSEAVQQALAEAMLQAKSAEPSVPQSGASTKHIPHAPSPKSVSPKPIPASEGSEDATTTTTPAAGSSTLVTPVSDESAAAAAGKKKPKTNRKKKTHKSKSQSVSSSSSAPQQQPQQQQQQ